MPFSLYYLILRLRLTIMFQAFGRSVFLGGHIANDVKGHSKALD